MRHDSRPGRDAPASIKGFTLIELMIVVAIAALLAVVALPSFKNQIQKARRADAKGALVTAAQMLERYSTEHGAAGYSTATVNDSAGPTVVYRSTTENGYYQLALSNVTPTTFLLTAVPQGGQASDSCANFTLDQNGVRNVTSMTRTSSDCW